MEPFHHHRDLDDRAFRYDERKAIAYNEVRIEMDEAPIAIPPDILEKYGKEVDPAEFARKVATAMSVKAERRSVGRPRKDA